MNCPISSTTTVVHIATNNSVIEEQLQHLQSENPSSTNFTSIHDTTTALTSTINSSPVKEILFSPTYQNLGALSTHAIFINRQNDDFLPSSEILNEKKKTKKMDKRKAKILVDETESKSTSRKKAKKDDLASTYGKFDILYLLLSPLSIMI